MQPMTIQLIGAGLGRTGTMSLKHAIERLLGGTCHHMAEVYGHPGEAPVWHAAMTGEYPDWHQFLEPYCAIVDFPGAALWREIADAFPDAPVLLSTRSSAEAWWKSADATIIEATRRARAGDDNDDPALAEQESMAVTMMNKVLTPQWSEAGPAMAAYDAHNTAVRAAIAPDRLFEYQPGDGWRPLCAALGVDEPDEEFPHTNTSAEFRQFAKFDEPPADPT